MAQCSNASIARALRDTATLLAQQGASPALVIVHRDAAHSVELMPSDLTRLYVRPTSKPQGLPVADLAIADSIIELATTGRLAKLERLRGASAPEHLFQNVPGIGPAFAHLIHEHLQVDSLAMLETAAHNGALDRVPGIGERRGKMIRQSLASILADRSLVNRRTKRLSPGDEIILDVDREYRRKAKAGELPLIAPKRCNPDGRVWLPILHTERGNWRFTAMFASSARAHGLAKTDDWVMIFYESGTQAEEMCTVTTEAAGAGPGQRAVNGRS